MKILYVILQHVVTAVQVCFAVYHVVTYLATLCWIKYRFVHMIQTVPLATRENYSTNGYIYFQGLIALIVASKESQ